MIPSTPRDLRVKLMDSHSALVTWTSSEPPQQQLVTSYYLEYKVTNDEQVSLKVVVNHNSTSLTGLQTHAGYQVRVRAVNGAGGGIWSDYQTFSTGKTCKMTFSNLLFCLCSFYSYNRGQTSLGHLGNVTNFLCFST